MTAEPVVFVHPDNVERITHAVVAAMLHRDMTDDEWFDIEEEYAMLRHLTAHSIAAVLERYYHVEGIEVTVSTTELKRLLTSQT